MPRYSVSGAVHGSTWIGEYDANTPEEAIELAYNDAGISLCHECARKISDPEVLELTAEDVETGDATSEKTVHDQIVEQAKEIERLRRAALGEAAENDRLRRQVDSLVEAADAARLLLLFAAGPHEAGAVPAMLAAAIERAKGKKP